MNKTYNVLIIDDHQIIIDTYKKALSFITESTDGLDFTVYEAKDCDSAYQISKEQTIDIVFLDIRLPSSHDNTFFSGETLGSEIKELHPNSKFIVCTSLNDNLRLNNISKTINPDGFLIKCDIGFSDIVNCIKKVLSNQTYFSQTIIELLRKKASSHIVLDDYDIQILSEMANSSSMKDLENVIPLSRRGIEQRKNKLKKVFNIKNNSDRDLVLIARSKGFI